MSKYIIELDDRIKLVTSVGVTENGVVYTTSDYVHNLEELNSDYINEHFGDMQDEAYQRGYKDCETRYCSFDACPNRQAEYKRGLDDAWECARKIGEHSMSSLEDAGFIFENDACEYNPSWYIVKHNTATEAIDKLKAYEEKQKADDKIKVGDEVTPNRNVGWKGVVVGIDDDNAMVMTSDGYSAMYRIEILCKTGRHFDIASILEEMRND